LDKRTNQITAIEISMRKELKVKKIFKDGPSRPEIKRVPMTEAQKYLEECIDIYEQYDPKSKQIPEKWEVPESKSDVLTSKDITSKETVFEQTKTVVPNDLSNIMQTDPKDHTLILRYEFHAECYEKNGVLYPMKGFFKGDAILDGKSIQQETSNISGKA
jgi:hypothetical protein